MVTDIKRLHLVQAPGQKQSCQSLELAQSVIDKIKSNLIPKDVSRVEVQFFEYLQPHLGESFMSQRLLFRYTEMETMKSKQR